MRTSSAYAQRDDSRLAANFLRSGPPLSARPAHPNSSRRGNFALSWTLKGLSIVSVLIVNHLLISVMEKLTEFERPHSRSAAELSKGVKLFLAQFINTLVVTLLVYANGARHLAASALPLRPLQLARCTAESAARRRSDL